MRLNTYVANKGFSFLQILLAVAILGISLAPAIHLFISSTDVISRGNAYLEATIVAQYVMDRAKNEDFITQNRGKSVKIPSDAYPDFYLPPHFLEKYKGHAQIDIGQYVDPDLRKITVTVYWTEQGDEYSTIVSTLSANMNDIVFRN